MHAHWLGRLIAAGAVDPSRLALVETAHPLAKSVARLVTRRVKLGDFTDVLPVVKDITDPPSDVEEGEGLEAETMAAGPPPGLAIPVSGALLPVAPIPHNTSDRRTSRRATCQAVFRDRLARRRAYSSCRNSRRKASYWLSTITASTCTGSSSDPFSNRCKRSSASGYRTSCSSARRGAAGTLARLMASQSPADYRLLAALPSTYSRSHT